MVRSRTTGVSQELPFLLLSVVEWLRQVPASFDIAQCIRHQGIEVNIPIKPIQRTKSAFEKLERGPSRSLLSLGAAVGGEQERDACLVVVVQESVFRDSFSSVIAMFPERRRE